LIRDSVRHLLAAAFLILVVVPAAPFAQTATVIHNVNLRPDSSSDHAAIRLLDVSLSVLYCWLSVCTSSVRHRATDPAVSSARGAIVRGASSAAEALEAIARRRPDVLLADVAMPEEDRYSLIRKVRSGERQQQAARLPAIAVTAYATARDREQAMAAGLTRTSRSRSIPMRWRARLPRWRRHRKSDKWHRSTQLWLLIVEDLRDQAERWVDACAEAGR
jgi:CheY-like chemotaxis protein